MKPVKQEDGLGCAVACVAFILQIPYSEAVKLFSDGKRRVKEEQTSTVLRLFKF
ncbi:hypothetical protein HYU93_01570 [Candidatus Daviesbacteria bacterium]|nr:hypothetical protein [Candidatus Daviesbacteria bacterium]